MDMCNVVGDRGFEVALHEPQRPTLVLHRAHMQQSNTEQYLIVRAEGTA